MLQVILCNPETPVALSALPCSSGVASQVRYSSSNPFIGKLSLKLLEVTNTKHGETVPPC